MGRNNVCLEVISRCLNAYQRRQHIDRLDQSASPVSEVNNFHKIHPGTDLREGVNLIDICSCWKFQQSVDDDVFVPERRRIL